MGPSTWPISTFNAPVATPTNVESAVLARRCYVGRRSVLYGCSARRNHICGAGIPRLGMLGLAPRWMDGWKKSTGADAPYLVPSALHAHDGDIDGSIDCQDGLLTGLDLHKADATPAVSPPPRPMGRNSLDADAGQQLAPESSGGSVRHAVRPYHPGVVDALMDDITNTSSGGLPWETGAAASRGDRNGSPADRDGNSGQEASFVSSVFQRPVDGRREKRRQQQLHLQDNRAPAAGVGQPSAAPGWVSELLSAAQRGMDEDPASQARGASSRQLDDASGASCSDTAGTRDNVASAGPDQDTLLDWQEWDQWAQRDRAASWGFAGDAVSSSSSSSGSSLGGWDAWGNPRPATDGSTVIAGSPAAGGRPESTTSSAGGGAAGGDNGFAYMWEEGDWRRVEWGARQALVGAEDASIAAASGTGRGPRRRSNGDWFLRGETDPLGYMDDNGWTHAATTAKPMSEPWVDFGEDGDLFNGKVFHGAYDRTGSSCSGRRDRGRGGADRSGRGGEARGAGRGGRRDGTAPRGGGLRGDSKMNVPSDDTFAGAYVDGRGGGGGAGAGGGGGGSSKGAARRSNDRLRRATTAASIAIPRNGIAATFPLLPVGFTDTAMATSTASHSPTPSPPTVRPEAAAAANQLEVVPADAGTTAVGAEPAAVESRGEPGEAAGRTESTASSSELPTAVRGSAAAGPVSVTSDAVSDVGASSHGSKTDAELWARVPLLYNFGPSFKLLEEASIQQLEPLPAELVCFARVIADASVSGHSDAPDGGATGLQDPAEAAEPPAAEEAVAGRHEPAGAKKSGGRRGAATTSGDVDDGGLLPGCTAFIMSGGYEAVLVQDARSLGAAITWLRASQSGDLVFGIDTEWPPVFSSGQTEKLAMLQVASPSRVLLLHVAQMKTSATAPGGPLHTFLSDQQLTWVACGWDSGDRRGFITAFGDAAPRMRVVDVQAAARAAGWPRVGLLGLVNELLGISEFTKPRRLSMCNWAHPELTDRQIRYAALDALLPPLLLRQLRLFAAMPALRCCFCKQAMHAPPGVAQNMPVRPPPRSAALVDTAESANTPSPPLITCEHCSRTFWRSQRADTNSVTRSAGTTGKTVVTSAPASSEAATAVGADPRVPGPASGAAPDPSAACVAAGAGGLGAFLLSAARGRQQYSRRLGRRLFGPDEGLGDMAASSARLASASVGVGVRRDGGSGGGDSENGDGGKGRQASQAKPGNAQSKRRKAGKKASRPVLDQGSVSSRQQAIWSAFEQASPSAAAAVAVATGGESGTGAKAEAGTRDS